MGAVDFGDREYPRLLKEISDAPDKLYFKGKWSSKLFDRCLAVVGSRRMTSYGERITKMLVSELSGAGSTIVSGFMYGIDATAHSAALAEGGKTVAVMPCGIDLIIPEYQAELYGEIVGGGGIVLSEYESDFPPAPWTFPARNRIAVGLVQAVLVVEGGLSSGSMITAGLARKYGRKLFAVPGNIDSKVSEGTLALIKEGAQMVTCAQDIADFFEIDLRESKIANLGAEETVEGTVINGVSKAIMQLLITSPKNLDQIVDNLGVTPLEALLQLSELELKGLVESKDGKYHAC